MKNCRLLPLCLSLCCMLLGLKAFSQDDIVSLRIMTYNIHHGAGSDDVLDLDRQAAVIANEAPDVIGLQEVDSCAKRTGYIHEAAVLGRKLGMYNTFGPAIRITGGKYGVAILSKEKPLTVRNIPLPGEEKRTLLVCEFQEYVFACTHLDLNEENRLASYDIIVEEAGRWEKPFFICGDWNDKPTSAFITKMKKKFRFLNYITSSSANYTFPAKNPTSIIDYIASYGQVTKSIKNRKVINEPTASDHRPVMVDVTFESLSTGILSPFVSDDKTPGGEIYDLSGRKMGHGKWPSGKLPQGIYLLTNGKKVAVGR